jgi:hypothetical protein
MTQDTTKHIEKCPFPTATGLVNEGCLCDECYYNSGIDCYCALEV